MYMTFVYVLISDCDKKLHPKAYEAPPSKYFAESLLKIVLNPHIDSDRVCHTWPVVGITSSATFVVNVTSMFVKTFLASGYIQGPTLFTFKAYFREDGSIRVEKCAPGASGDVYYLRRLHSYHPSNPDFKRMIAFVSGMSSLQFCSVLICL